MRLFIREILRFRAVEPYDDRSDTEPRGKRARGNCSGRRARSDRSGTQTRPGAVADKRPVARDDGRRRRDRLCARVRNRFDVQEAFRPAPLGRAAGAAGAVRRQAGRDHSARHGGGDPRTEAKATAAQAEACPDPDCGRRADSVEPEQRHRLLRTGDELTGADRQLTAADRQLTAAKLRQQRVLGEQRILREQRLVVVGEQRLEFGRLIFPGSARGVAELRQ